MSGVVQAARVMVRIQPKSQQLPMLGVEIG